MKRLAVAAVMTTAMFATSAQAVEHVLDLTGDVTGLITNSFMSGGNLFDTGVLSLTGFNPFTVQGDDTVLGRVTLTNGPFSLPVRDNMFFGLNFENIFGGMQPLDSMSNGEFRFDGGPAVGAGCGNCLSLISFQNNMPLSFNTLEASGAFVLGTDYDVNSITISYQVNNTAVPEPTTWALMILGFGSAGAMLRRRRQSLTFAGT